MKKKLFLIVLLFGIFSVLGQGRIRIAYIDMDYILDNLPEYQTALKELDHKADRWKAEIEKRTKEINDMKLALEQEKVLLTKELLQEKSEEIEFKEKSLLKYQLEKFGPEGDYILQKQNLVAPVQDRIFNAVAKLVQTSKYDIVFDKSNEKLGIIYTNPKMDISEKILKLIKKVRKKEQRKKDLKSRSEKRKKELSEAQKRRAELIAKRKKEREEKRKKMLEESKKLREKKELNKQEKISEEKVQNKENASKPNNAKEEIEQPEQKKLSKEQLSALRKQEREARRQRILEERKKNKSKKNNQ